MSGRFAGRRAIVTGASSGIGAAIASGLAAEGAAVTAVARAAGPAAPGLAWAALDLASDAAIGAFVQARAGEALDLLVLAAGLLEGGGVAETPIAHLDRQLQVNLRAPWLLVQGLLPALRRGAEGAGRSRWSIPASGSMPGPGARAMPPRNTRSGPLPTRCGPRSIRTGSGS